MKPTKVQICECKYFPVLSPDILQTHSSSKLACAFEPTEHRSCSKGCKCTLEKQQDSMDLSKVMLDELKRFCENTTIRGLPRIVRARGRWLKLLWIMLVCFLVLGCFICMLFLAKQYLEYDVIHPPRVLRQTKSPFPAVTVCNLRPISQDGLQYLERKSWKTPREFVTDLERYTRNMYMKKNASLYQAASMAFNLAGFLESLPSKEEQEKLGYQQDKFIIKCQVSELYRS